MGREATEITVSMIHPRTWEDDGEVLEITDPIPVDEWIEKSTRPGDEVLRLPSDSLIEGGRYDGGHVLMVNMDGDSFLFAVPPEAIPLLEGVLPDEEYRELVAHTPRLAGIAARF